MENWKSSLDFPEAFQDMSSRDIQKKKGLQEPQTTAVCCGKSNGATIVGT
jgi:hypothetical protein